MAARHEKRFFEENSFVDFLGRKRLSHDGIELAGGTAFNETRPGAGFKTGDYVAEELAGLPKNDSVVNISPVKSVDCVPRLTLLEEPTSRPNAAAETFSRFEP